MLSIKRETTHKSKNSKDSENKNPECLKTRAADYLSEAVEVYDFCARRMLISGGACTTPQEVIVVLLF
jgi:hypothetical protein